MTFLGLSQTMGWLLAGGTATAILVIFFLRIQHRRVFVSSSILWERVLERRKRRSLIEWLRRLISLLIALAIGLSLAMAFGEVELGLAGRKPRDVRLVVDNRPTMAALMSDGRSRLDHAMDRADELLAGGSSADRFTVYDADGVVVAAATRDRDAVREALADLRPTARSLKLPLAEEGTETWLLTDGVGAAEVPTEVRVVGLYEPVVNAGVTAFEIRPQPTDPYRYEAFLEVGNFSVDAKAVTITLRDDAGVQFRRVVELEPGGLYRNTFDLGRLDGGELRAEVAVEGDGYALDDRAHVWLPRTAPVRLAYVSASHGLTFLLQSVPHLEVTVMEPADYSALEDGDLFDAYLFEGWAPAAAPALPTVLLGPPAVDWLPRHLGVAEHVGLLPFDTAAPLLRHVDLHDIAIARAIVVDPLDAVILAGDAELPLILSGLQPTRWLMFSFAIADTDFEQAVGFPILVSNLVQWLRGDAPARRVDLGTVAIDLPRARVRNLSTDSPVEVRTVGGRTIFRATTPALYMATDGSRRLHYAARLDGRERSMVNASIFELPDAQLESPAASRPLWPILLGVAAVLLLVEGLTYHRRITV